MTVKETEVSWSRQGLPSLTFIRFYPIHRASQRCWRRVPGVRKQVSRESFQPIRNSPFGIYTQSWPCAANQIWLGEGLPGKHGARGMQDAREGTQDACRSVVEWRSGIGGKTLSQDEHRHQEPIPRVRAYNSIVRSSGLEEWRWKEHTPVGDVSQL